MLSRNQVLQQGRYHIISQFEHKEAGISYKAFDNVLKKDVIINETSSDSNNLNAYFKAPVAKHLENLTSINHEFFTQVHGFFSELDQQYLVTEAIEGKNLQEVLGKKSTADFPTILIWIEQIIEALNYLHSKKTPIIHCDITPASLILTKENKIKLLTYLLISDLCISQTQSQENQFSESKLPYLPLETIWTTLDYASQKVILNSYDEKSAEVLTSPPDERTDIYSLGATIYHLVTEKSPTSALERSIEVLEGNEDPLLSPHILNPTIPQNISAFLLKALEIKRENRFESVSAMLKAWQLITGNIKTISETDITEKLLNRGELAGQTLREQKEESQLDNTQNTLNLKKESVQNGEEIGESVKVKKEQLLEKLTKSQFDESRPLETKIRKSNESILVVEALEPQKVIFDSVPTKSVNSPVDSSIVSAKKETEEELFAFPDESSHKSSRWLIPVVCGVLILSIVGFFGYRYFDANTQVNAVTPSVEKLSESKNSIEDEAKPNEISSQSNSSADKSVISESNSVTETNLNQLSEDNTAETETQKTSGIVETQKTNEVLAKPKKSNTLVSPIDTKTPTAAKTPVTEKKKVTVDDIINDN